MLKVKIAIKKQIQSTTADDVSFCYYRTGKWHITHSQSKLDQNVCGCSVFTCISVSDLIWYAFSVSQWSKNSNGF